MAHRLAISGTHYAKFIYNVSAHVGPGQADSNNPDDVQLVQFLLREIIKAEALPRKVAPPNPTGQFDAATGFWIYLFQNAIHGAVKKAVIDGTVSPAKNALYDINSPWMIVFLNIRLQILAPQIFNGILTNQELRPSLRASLK